MKKVLVVEDDRLFLISLEWALDKIGCQVAAVVDNAEDALLFLRKEQPDLIITDISIKGKMNGLDLVRKVRELHPVPVIFITAFEDQELFRQASAIRHASFLVKPLTVATLRNTVQQLFSP